MTALQDLMPGNNCFGCGPDNELGMQIKSHFEGGEWVCRYMPKPEQCAGPPQYVYGGTIASLVDCHSVCAATGNYYMMEERGADSEPEIWCVTGRLTVNYLAPTPIDTEIVLRATIEEAAEKKTIVKCRVFSGDTQTAEGDVIAVRVPSAWKDGS